MIADPRPIACPAGDSWLQLLRDEVSPSDRDELETHLESCNACRDAFVGIAGDWSLAGRINVAAIGANTHAVLAGVLHRPGDPPVSLRPEVEPIAPPDIPGLVDWQEIGRGGMGVVFRARQVALERVVAVKVLSSSVLSPSARARAIREGLTLARLRHPNIVAIFGSGEADGLPFLVMEFVEGGSLQQRLDKQSERIPIREAAALVRDLARAVAEAHSLGIVHRDLKPANILLSAGTPVVPKLADFGLARAWGDGDDSNVTETGMVLGTPSYMAPEQTGLRGSRGQVGPATDVHGLGAILHAMLTGKPPYGGDSTWQALLRVSQGTPDAVRKLRPDVPRDLETIVARCLESSPARRYRSAGELADELDRFLDGRPVLARPISWPLRAAKFARRKPAVATAAVFAIVAVIAAGAGAAYHIRAQAKSLTQLEDQQIKTNAALTESLAARNRALRAIKSLMDRPVQEMLNRGGSRNDQDFAFLNNVAALLNEPFANPETPVDAMERAKVLEQLMQAYSRLGHFDDVIKTANAIVAIYAGILKANPKHEDARWGTVGILDLCSIQLADAKKLDEAIAFSKRHNAFLEEHYPDTPWRSHRLALGLLTIANASHFRAANQTALEFTVKAVDVLEPAHRAEQNDAGILFNLIRASSMRGSLLADLNRTDESRAAYARSAELIAEGRKRGIPPEAFNAPELHALSGMARSLETANDLERALAARKRILELARLLAYPIGSPFNEKHIWIISVEGYHRTGARLNRPRTGLDEANDLVATLSAQRASAPSVFAVALANISALRARAIIEFDMGQYNESLKDCETSAQLAFEWAKKPEGRERLSEQLVMIASLASEIHTRANRPDIAIKVWEQLAPACVNNDRNICDAAMERLRGLIKTMKRP